MSATARSPLSFNVGGGEPIESTGWDALSTAAAEKLNEEQFQAYLETASIYRQVFTSELGRLVLEDMISKYLAVRIVDEGQDSTRADAIRQGRMDVVAEILGLIEFANTGGGRPPNPTE